ncbi:MAG: hypothetical protein FWF44_02020 [Defluviitaleaceae bacterium]|nr:hypothetical protein [Defluviitaleaceae bacterium]
MQLTQPLILHAMEATGGLRAGPLPGSFCAVCETGLYDFDGYFDICGEQFCMDCAYRVFYKII